MKNMQTVKITVAQALLLLSELHKSTKDAGNYKLANSLADTFAGLVNSAHDLGQKPNSIVCSAMVDIDGTQSIIDEATGAQDDEEPVPDDMQVFGFDLDTMSPEQIAEKIQSILATAKAGDQQ
ncbi:hypothetical protein [Lacticaseibacillus zhaodongensis]|uniref:hypothetical protein n=1 Tax=Lacticaseibacillus zhaodongensis TaxID=2668065 RepID=UPI0012D30BC9|nr:hypothetical protein [Lacticaseibacillus zhaodongensis]